MSDDPAGAAADDDGTPGGLGGTPPRKFEGGTFTIGEGTGGLTKAYCT